MKKSFLHFIKPFGVVLLSLCLLSASKADNIMLKRGEKTELQIKQQSETSISFVNKLEGIKIIKTKTSKRDFVSLGAPGYVGSHQVGYPQLPVKAELIEVPLGATPKIKINNFTVKEFKLADYGANAKVIPAQAPASKSEDFHAFKINDEAYQQNEYNATDLVEVKVMGIMRDTRIALVKVNPVRYNPVSNTIKVFEDIDFEIVMENADLAATKELKAKTASPFFASTNNRMITNYRDNENVTKYPVKYVIVADRMFEESLAPFIEWKTKKGFKVITAYTDEAGVGNTTSSIKGYIKGLYDAGTAEDPAPSFVLFVGDVQQIPVFEPTANGETDRFYCEYTNDFFPEIYYGRFSAQTVEQCDAYVEKTLMYEQYTMPDPSYLDNVLLVSGVDDNWAPTNGNGAINYGTENYFNTDNGIDAEVYLFPESEGAHDEIISALSNGVTFTNYTAHCSPDGWAGPVLSRANVDELTNEGKYGLMIGNCCSSSEYAQNECFSEKITRTPKKGCWGYIGGSNSTYWDEDYHWGVGLGEISNPPPAYDDTGLGAYDRAFHTHGEAFDQWYVTASQIVVAGNLAVTASDSPRKEYYWDIYNIAGDPSTMVYMGLPTPIDPTYPAAINIGTPSVTIDACPYAYVGISKDGVLYGAALADETGSVEVPLEGIDFAGQLDLVITAQNKQPYIGTITMKAGDGPFVMIEESSVNDTEGNGNGNADYNETIRFNIKLKNFGNETAENLNVTITTENTNITILENTIAWDNIPADGSVEKEAVLKVKLNESIPDGELVKLVATISDGNEEWISKIKFNAHAPVLVPNQVLAITEVDGNNDGIVDPGETVNITASIANTGSSSIMNIEASLICSDPKLEVITGSGEIVSIDAGNTATVVFKAKAKEECTVGTNINFAIEYNSGEFSVSENYVLSVGLIFDNFESGTFDKFPWETSGEVDWTIAEGGPEGSNYYANCHMTGDNVSSILKVVYTVASESDISFDYKVSTEEDWDHLIFTVDGVEKGKWNGQVDWSNTSYTIAPGEHTFQWEFKKDGSYDGNNNTVSIDNIIFPLGVPPAPMISVVASDYLKMQDNGNSNGQADPGETVNLTVGVMHMSGSDLSNIAATLSSSNSDVNITNNTATIASLTQGGEANIDFAFDLSADATVGEEIEFTLNLTAEGFETNIPYSIIIGSKVEDFETGDFTKFPWTFTGNAEWTVVDGGNGSSEKIAKVTLPENNSTGAMKLNVVLPEAAKIQFDYKTEEMNGASISFIVDDIALATISGDNDWKTAKYDLTEGQHIISWEINGSASKGTAVFLDNIILPIDFEVSVQEMNIVESKTQIYPNPTEGILNISYFNKKAADINVQVFNTMGQMVKTKAEGMKQGGQHELQLNLNNLPSGAYQVVILSGSARSSYTIVVK